MSKPAISQDEIAEELSVDTAAKTWISERAAVEAERLRSNGVRPLLMQVRNYGIVRQEEHKSMLVINRVEIDTGFDFEQRVKQIMVSDPIPYPNKGDFSYVNVLLLTEKLELPLLVPYIYPNAVQSKTKGSGSDKSKKGEKLVKNDLKEWLLINSKGQRSRHSIHEYHSI
ncbi:hypothetical protein HK104_006690 [Borealophlyctis nickersoniae]|nr:hypothetical protein HK104_006690 [Borealophlyctis nickersoniae]